MNDPDVERFLNEMVKSVGFLNRKGRKQATKRGRELTDILRVISKYKIGIHETRDLARQEFRAAIQEYVLGFFDDSIHHALFSVEMGLLIRLEETLTNEEKNKIHDEINRVDGKPLSFTFGEILNRARDKTIGIIGGKQLNDRIESLVEKRNEYVHASNFLSGLIISMKKNTVPKMEGQIRSISDLEKQLYVRSLFPSIIRLKPILSQELAKTRLMPDFAWCTKDERRTAVQKEVEEYMTALDKLEKRSANISIRNLLRMPQLVRLILDESYFKMQNLKILEDSLEILKGIDIF
jgi:hypothetical protein